MKRRSLVWVAAFQILLVAAVQGESSVGESKLANPAYTIQKALQRPLLDGNWEGPAWKDVPVIDITHFYLPERAQHHPKAQARALYDDAGIYIHFRVEDQFVRAIETKYHGKVWEDACAEFFVQPLPERGYFNFEINCGGTMLLSYQENPNWKGPSLRKAGEVPWKLAKKVEIFHSMPKTVEPEQIEPVTWHLEYFIPFEVLDAYLGELGTPGGQTWRANFYKCAENNSQPHWASWSPIAGKLDFHQPQYFAPIHFAE